MSNRPLELSAHFVNTLVQRWRSVWTFLLIYRSDNLFENSRRWLTLLGLKRDLSNGKQNHRNSRPTRVFFFIMSEFPWYRFIVKSNGESLFLFFSWVIISRNQLQLVPRARVGSDHGDGCRFYDRPKIAAARSAKRGSSTWRHPRSMSAFTAHPEYRVCG